jgi:hypothetical protein
LFALRVNNPDFGGIDLFVSPDALRDCDPGVLLKPTGVPAAAMRQLHGNAILYTPRAINNRENSDFFKGISHFVAPAQQGTHQGTMTLTEKGTVTLTPAS